MGIKEETQEMLYSNNISNCEEALEILKKNQIEIADKKALIRLGKTVFKKLKDEGLSNYSIDNDDALKYEKNIIEKSIRLGKLPQGLIYGRRITSNKSAGIKYFEEALSIFKGNKS